jgi:hypothetical protein
MKVVLTYIAILGDLLVISKIFISVRPSLAVTCNSRSLWGLSAETVARDRNCHIATSIFQVQ